MFKLHGTPMATIFENSFIILKKVKIHAQKTWISNNTSNFIRGYINEKVF